MPEREGFVCAHPDPSLARPCAPTLTPLWHARVNKALGHFDISIGVSLLFTSFLSRSLYVQTAFPATKYFSLIQYE